MEQNNEMLKSLSFWDIFCQEYQTNCLAWKHADRNPVIPAEGSGWKEKWTANPDFIEYKGKKLLYYRGYGVTGSEPSRHHDRIAVAEVLEVSPDGLDYVDLNDGNFVTDVGNPGDFDGEEVLDPAAVSFEGKLYLYYSAVGAGPDSVGLAVSEDGIYFQKKGKVLTGRAPDVIEKDGSVFMIYQKDGGDGYRGFYLAQSPNGIDFTNVSEEPVFQVPERDDWDCQVSTARLFRQEDFYYLLYGGNPNKVDQPDYFGLARSRDLIHWERHPGNPIFGCGAKGTEDGGSIWFPALLEKEDYYILLYEGSRGDYHWQLSSQICLSSIRKDKLQQRLVQQAT